MTIEYLSGMIADLAVEYGRVMLPGLGVFVCEAAPASFADKGFTILPPYRRLAFRESQGDGTLLYEKYAAAAKLSPARAQSEIASVVEQIVSLLDEDGVAELPGLGKLKRTVSGSVLFVADEDLDVSAELMALNPVSLKTQRRETVSLSNEDTSAITKPSSSSSDGSVGEGKDNVEDADSEADAADNRGNGCKNGADRCASVAERNSILSPKSDPIAKEGESVDENSKGDGAGQLSQPRKRRGQLVRSGAFVVLIIVLSLAALFVALFYAGVYFFPELLDRLLYSAEELELLHFFGL